MVRLCANTPQNVYAPRYEKPLRRWKVFHWLPLKQQECWTWGENWNARKSITWMRRPQNDLAHFVWRSHRSGCWPLEHSATQSVDHLAGSFKFPFSANESVGRTWMVCTWLQELERCPSTVPVLQFDRVFWGSDWNTILHDRSDLFSGFCWKKASIYSCSWHWLRSIDHRSERIKNANQQPHQFYAVWFRIL